MGAFLENYGAMLVQGTWDTLYMSFLSALFAYLMGLPLGVALAVTEPHHILPRPHVNRILNTVVNIVRSVPFIILLIAVIPFTRWLVGTSIGVTASIVPLVIGAVPFVARLVESSMKELRKGIIEAATAMGASPFQIIYKVMIPETMPSLVLGASITTITLIGYSAMAGAVGGGGLGDLAIRYGYYRYDTTLMMVTIVLLVLIVQGVQLAGTRLSKKINRQ
ncbi:methionine ABC transporter permease [Anaerotalea alkaliphila]|uniref:ABC transporter permease n=1 Tax=Anaerotalea alkaliphila TaxID=2662126 RepID=A0A7X5HUW3_9FIRM|nr:methionine ABC transporter permease [Anaerotalea alkaliphila]NDL67123.1 ABC transporter permease [Anaerotalea alkaliphila]